MRKRYLYISSFLIVASIFSLLFSFGYRLTRTNSVNDNVTTPTPESARVDTNSPDRITDKTIYELEILQVNDETIRSQNETIPADFAGKTREELNEWLDEYMEQMPLEESLKGLVSFELMSFSKDKIILRKTYQDLAKENKYYLTLVNNEVVVYYNDKRTVYEYTGISADQLSADEIAMLMIGYFVEGEEELFGILENYSS